MKKILFINPPNNPFSSCGILIEPIDIIHLATFIKSLGYDVQFLDMDVRKLSISFLNSFLIENLFDIVIIPFDYHIPLHDEGTNKNIHEILKVTNNLGIISILGGKIATYYSEEQLSNWNANFFIKHDMEQPLKLLLEKLDNNNNDFSDIPNLRIKTNNKILENKTLKQNISIDSFPIPDRTLCDLNDYIDVRTILSSRGCNMKCSFCHVPGFWGKWQHRSPQSVVEEILLLQEKFNAKKILFLDDNALAQPERMNELSGLLISQESKATLGCLGTIFSFNDKVMQNMFKAGFRWIHYGAETVDPIQLKNINKRIDIAKMQNAIKRTKEIGFRLRTSWILDLPGLTKEGLLATEKFIIENPTDEIRLHFLTLRLGSQLHQEYQIETKQFIHNSNQNINISGIDSSLIKESLYRILSRLEEKGYVIVYNPDDFINIEYLKQQSPGLKIVSLCPLRYGLGWNNT